jgi:hypothetical protein
MLSIKFFHELWWINFDSEKAATRACFLCESIMYRVVYMSSDLTLNVSFRLRTLQHIIPVPFMHLPW